MSEVQSKAAESGKKELEIIVDYGYGKELQEDLVSDEVYPDHVRVTMVIRVRDAVNDARENRILLQPEFQREYIWTRTQATRLIDSILRNLGIPELWLWQHIPKDGIEWEMLDGQQRLHSLVSILTDEIEFEGFEGRFKQYNKMKFSQLPTELQETIKNYNLTFMCVKNHGDNILAKRAYFYRLNRYPKPLRPQELRNCMFAGGFTDFLKEMAKRITSTYSVFEASRGSAVMYVTCFFALVDTPLEANFRTKAQYLDQYMVNKIKDLGNDKEKLKAEIKKKRALFDGTLNLVQQVFQNDAFKEPTMLENQTIVYQLVARTHISPDMLYLMMWGFYPYLEFAAQVIANARAVRDAFATFVIEMQYNHQYPFFTSKKRFLTFLEGWYAKLRTIFPELRISERNIKGKDDGKQS